MKIKNLYKSACLLGLIALGTTTCEDWLTLYPPDRVVEENFWEDKNDLEGVRYAAYKSMCGTIRNFAVWGDLRSDTYVLNPVDHSDQGSRDTYDEIMKAMPDSSMTIFDWSGVYTTINYCNKVLQHGAEVLEKDKQFTTSEWLQMRAEITGLRALNYFYLLRAFKDIPYTTKVINKDVEVETFGLTNQLDVLDSIILDVEKVKGQARNRFTNPYDTKGLITNSALYAMLADMYLWRASLHEGRGLAEDTIATDTGLVAHSVRGDYQLAVDYADQALYALNYQSEQSNQNYGTQIAMKQNYGLTYCDMISNRFEEQNLVTGGYATLYAQNRIFNSGNSDESIFEIQFSGSDNRKNPAVHHLYGYSNGTHLAVSDYAISACYNGNADAMKYDSRLWVSYQNQMRGESATLQGYYCLKYKYPDIRISEDSQKQISAEIVSSSDYVNWIIYRMTGVMLIKAEALACLGGADNNKKCQQIVNAIHRRSYCDLKNGNVPDTDVTSTSSNTVGNAVSMGSDYVKLVMNERQIELLGEGQRWFDLVRFAERKAGGMNGTVDEREWTEEQPIGSGFAGVTLMVDTYLKNTYSSLYTTLKNRMKNRYGLYCPIYYMEVKASNGEIQQNPVWNKSKYDN